MTADELKTARTRLGLKASELGRALELGGRDPGQQVSRWEKGAAPIPGPAAVAIRYMVAQVAHEADTAHAVAVAIQADRERRAADGMPPVPRAMTDLMRVPKITRRRGA